MEKMMNNRYNVKLKSDAFKPRAFTGEILMMEKGIDAEEGDIVAISESSVAFYQVGMEYNAVCVAVIRNFR